MLKKMSIIAVACTAYALPNMTSAAFMDAAWAQKACSAWNGDKTLTNELGKKWIKNDKGRGYKLVQIYRDKCGAGSKIQLTIANEGGKAKCIRGGNPDGKALNYDADYVMHAKDDDWTCIGKGSFGCGAMGAMASGKLKFKGPKMEAMNVMGPFGSFLKLTGTVGGDKGTCN